MPAGEKTIDVIEFMATSATPRTKSEIAAGVGRSIQEVYRIIQLLVDRGYLVSDEEGDRFSLSMRVFALAHSMPAISSLSEAAIAPMKKLVAEVNQSCHLGMLWDDEVVIVAQFNSPLSMVYSVALGARFPAHETSSGLVLLAGRDPESVDRQLSRIASEEDQRNDISRIRELVTEVRVQGYDVRPSLMVEGITNISYPVRNFRGDTIAALTVPFIPIKRSTRPIAETASAVANAALSISLAMGWTA